MKVKALSFYRDVKGKVELGKLGGWRAGSFRVLPLYHRRLGYVWREGDLEARSERGAKANQEVNLSPMTWGPPGHGYIMVSPRAIVAFFSAVL